jgi:putative acetyltransferase
MKVSIRVERSRDQEAVFEVNAQAFETPAEAKLVDALRPAVKPLISLVAVHKKETVVGHILFTPVRVGAAGKAMALGPMAVRPDFQRKGIGSRLVRAGLDACRHRGHGVVFVLGHADFYPRFGFQPAASLGFRYGSSELDRYFMVAELTSKALKGLAGSVKYHPEFDSF